MKTYFDPTTDAYGGTHADPFGFVPYSPATTVQKRVTDDIRLLELPDDPLGLDGDTLQKDPRTKMTTTIENGLEVTRDGTGSVRRISAIPRVAQHERTFRKSSTEEGVVRTMVSGHRVRVMPGEEREFERIDHALSRLLCEVGYPRPAAQLMPSSTNGGDSLPVGF